jgi:hypothetical protein
MAGPTTGRRGRRKNSLLSQSLRHRAAEHYKYPETVGNDTIANNINFNSDASSEYAIQRMDAISEATSEPFMMFEFMKITEKTFEEEEKVRDAMHSYINSANISEEANILNEGLLGGPGITFQDQELINENKKRQQELKEQQAKLAPKVRGFFSFQKAFREFTGSISLYMPTDIQINDSMVYTEDTRKFGAIIENMKTGGDADFELGSVLNTAGFAGIFGAAAMGANALGKGGPTATLLSALGGGAIGDIVGTEVQRSLGKTGNPNEFAAYENTSLRTFTFNWVMLPDNENESDQVAGLIQFFRKSAHATKKGPTRIVVPDEVVVSFHGAKDMIQIPPCFIESVNVTYNPNVSSFFKRNNAPVEVQLGVTLKEIVPIYSGDVEGGF